MSPSSAHPELTAALSEMIDKLDQWMRGGGYSGDPIEMYLAGGMAMHFSSWYSSTFTARS